FGLIPASGKPPIAVDGCGAAGQAATVEFYKGKGLSAIPSRGPLAANTVAGTLSGWAEVIAINKEMGGKLPLSRLVEDGAWSAENGFAITATQQELTETKFAELKDSPGFVDTFLLGGKLPKEGQLMKLPALGATLKRLGQHGPMDFYTGALAKEIAADLARCGSPVTLADLAAQKAQRRQALSVAVKGATLYNFPPPTQGLASLMILAIFERLGVKEAETFEYLHCVVEATKQAFLVRDRIVGDPALMEEKAEHYLTSATLDGLAANVNRKRALPWPMPVNPGDTVWLGAVDKDGIAVSFIQSIYFEFGSGCVLENSGIVWQNRGSSFLLV
ncbi:MAG TPA: gamma-glutamyltransferase, partial [Afipia sp.]|nr:gamma-glutamyltransferase [Afipia sp.]